MPDVRVYHNAIVKVSVIQSLDPLAQNYEGPCSFGSCSRSPNAAEPSKGPKPYANAALNLVNVYYIKYSSSLIMQTQKEMCDQAIIFRPGV